MTLALVIIVLIIGVALGTLEFLREVFKGFHDKSLNIPLPCSRCHEVVAVIRKADFVKDFSVVERNGVVCTDCIEEEIILKDS